MVKADFRLFYLLNDPIAAVDYFLPSVIRPSHASDLDWNNHLFGLVAIVCEYVSQLRGEPIHYSIEFVKDELLLRGTIKHMDKV